MSHSLKLSLSKVKNISKFFDHYNQPLSSEINLKSFKDLKCGEVENAKETLYENLKLFINNHTKNKKDKIRLIQFLIEENFVKYERKTSKLADFINFKTTTLPNLKEKEITEVFINFAKKHNINNFNLGYVFLYENLKQDIQIFVNFYMSLQENTYVDFTAHPIVRSGKHNLQNIFKPLNQPLFCWLNGLSIDDVFNEETLNCFESLSSSSKAKFVFFEVPKIEKEQDFYFDFLTEEKYDFESLEELFDYYNKDKKIQSFLNLKALMFS